MMYLIVKKNLSADNSKIYRTQMPSFHVGNALKTSKSCKNSSVTLTS